MQRTRENIVAGRRITQAVDMLRLVDETRDLLVHDLAQADVELEIPRAGSVPPVQGDPVELQQVLVNLVSNAVDAMRDQTAPRRIMVEVVAEGESVRIRVLDNGPGIPEGDLEKLFDPFFTTKATGIGMGLQICRSAVEAMGGQLTVMNMEGAGACFSFDLPAVQPE